MLSEADRSILCSAVPSFEPKWQAWCANEAKQAERFPEDTPTSNELSHDFLSQLARHVGQRIAAGELTEAESLFSALEQLYARADEELEMKLTVGFLEDLIVVAAHERAMLPSLDAVAAAAGPRVSDGYTTARDYLRGPPGTPDAEYWVRP
jgi:hypothetical protein